MRESWKAGRLESRKKKLTADRDFSRKAMTLEGLDA
jgi:hypothetical protein